MSQSFGDRLAARVRAVGSPTCVGLDPHLGRLPPSVFDGSDGRALAEGAERFFRGVIEVVAPRVAAVKPQVAFFEQLGSPGVAALERVCHAARDAGLIVLLDAKRGDIGSTAAAYAKATLDDHGPIGADAVTLAPYLGAESMEPFLARTQAGKGLFVLVRTSNPGSDRWQVGGEGAMAERVAAWIASVNAGHDGYGPVGAVVGATIPEGAAAWRDKMPKTWFLVPGYGAQGATAEQVGGRADGDGLGSLVPASRAVLFPKQGTDGGDWQAQVDARCQALVADVARVLPVR